jgi:hypothetical protein
MNGADCAHAKWNKYMFGYEIPWPLIVESKELQPNRIDSCGAARANSTESFELFKPVFGQRKNVDVGTTLTFTPLFV